MASTTQFFTVTTRREGAVSFSSDLSDEQVKTILQGLTSQFAQDLARKFHKLSPAQYAWAHKLAVDNSKPAEPVKDSNSNQYADLFSVFQNLRKKGAKRLKLRLMGCALSLSRDGNSIWVVNPDEMVEGNYGLTPRYLGKVTVNEISQSVPNSIRQTIELAASDPLTAVIQYGRETGNCSCCGRTLSDPVSIERGIGPICAEKWGL